MPYTYTTPKWEYNPQTLRREKIGVEERTVEAASMRKAALERAQCGVLLCDSSKIGQHRVYNLAHINDFRYIVTDDPERPANTTATVLRVRTGGLK